MKQNLLNFLQSRYSGVIENLDWISKPSMNMDLINIILSENSNIDQSVIQKEIQNFLQQANHNVSYQIVFSKLKSSNNNSGNSKSGFNKFTSINKKSIKGINKTILVGSGKGGVGKSTVAANLAASLSYMGWRVGLLDVDIYGACIPLLFNLQDNFIDTDQNQKMIPIKVQGYENLFLNSIAFIVKSDEALVWRGPMIVKAMLQILKQTAWPELDFLIIDSPPGTGDIHLSLLDNLKIDEVLLVSNCHISSIANTQKTFTMLQKFDIQNFHLVLNNFDQKQYDLSLQHSLYKNAEFIVECGDYFPIEHFTMDDHRLFFEQNLQAKQCFIDLAKKIIL